MLQEKFLNYGQRFWRYLCRFLLAVRVAKRREKHSLDWVSNLLRIGRERERKWGRERGSEGGGNGEGREEIPWTSILSPLRDYETEVQDLPGHQSHNSGIYEHLECMSVRSCLIQSIPVKLTFLLSNTWSKMKKWWIIWWFEQQKCFYLWYRWWHVIYICALLYVLLMMTGAPTPIRLFYPYQLAFIPKFDVPFIFEIKIVDIALV